MSIPKKQDTNFSVEIRTRSKTGQIFKLQSSTDSVSLHLTEKGVDFVYSNSTNSMRDPLAVKFNDGQWHTVILRESSGKLFAEFDSSPLLPLLAPFSLTKFVVDKNARLLFGKGPNMTSFKGCLQNVLIDDLPQLSFLPKEVFGGGFKTTRHFVPISFENIRNDGCKSREFADFCRLKGEKNAPSCVHGGCRNIWNGFLCQCDEGWTGAHCEIDVNECLEFPCANNGTCINTAGGFKCECAEFHLGNTCEVVGVCATHPCVHGTCFQHSATEFKCECEKGFQGKNCEEQIDYCKDEPCKNGATCQKLIGGFNCLCIAGFTGETCLTDIDDCVPGACANGGRCIDRVNGFECNCNSTGYVGAQCTEDVDECSLQLISNYCINGLCQNSPGKYNCQCEEGFIGPKCNMINPCLPDILNRTLHNCVHGICRDPVVVTLPSGREVAQHSCECFTGFTGPQCTHEIQKHYAIAFGYILGPVAAILIVLWPLFPVHPRTNRESDADVHDGSPKIAVAAVKQAPPRTPDLKLKIRSAPFPPKRQQTDSKPIAVGTTWAFAVHPVDET
uniref:Uncharacterized protein n=1 Tax=Panagrolaimus sp. JU765 TaxID=591449 RepID=A0AC34R210_9BILA